MSSNYEETQTTLLPKVYYHLFSIAFYYQAICVSMFFLVDQYDRRLLQCSILVRYIYANQLNAFIWISINQVFWSHFTNLIHQVRRYNENRIHRFIQYIL
jgi:hypothetical protein